MPKPDSFKASPRKTKALFKPLEKLKTTQHAEKKAHWADYKNTLIKQRKAPDFSSLKQFASSRSKVLPRKKALLSLLANFDL